MSPSTKRSILVLFSFSLAAILLLSAGLSGIRLRPGTPFPGGTSPQQALPQNPAPSSEKSSSVSLLQGILALAFMALVFQVLVRLIARAGVKNVVLPLVLLVVLFIVLILLPRMQPNESVSLPPDSSEIPYAAETEYPVSPLGEPPGIFTWLVIGGLAIGAGILALSLGGRRSEDGRASDPLQEEAMAAVDALKAGQDFRDVIIRCYLRMLLVLQDEQGMQRDENMTAREFERSLESRGIPAYPVHQLTTLFEKVRYGRQPASDEDRLLGRECLEQIIGFSKGVKAGG